MSKSSETSRIVKAPLQGALVVTGPERLQWLQGLLSCDLLAPGGHGLHGLALERHGKIVAELLVLCEPERVLLAVLGGDFALVQRHLAALLVVEDAELCVLEGLALWAAPGQGPDALLALGVTNAVELPYFTERDAFGFAPVQTVPAEQRLEDWDAWRLEAGRPRFGVDYDAQDNPHHAGLFDATCCTTKGCYLGQEVVCRVELRGRVPRRVVALRLEGDGEVAPEAELVVVASGESLGRPTSLGRGPSGQRFALIRLSSAVLGAGGDWGLGPLRASIHAGSVAR